MSTSSEGSDQSGEVEQHSSLSDAQEVIARLSDQETRCRAQGFDATADALQELIADMVRDLNS